MKRSLIILLALAMVSVPALASFHPDPEIDRWGHVAWHSQLSWQAAMAGNWSTAWQLFLEQSICANTWDTALFTPAGLLTAVTLLTLLFLFATMKLMKFLVAHKVRKGYRTQLCHTA